MEVWYFYFNWFFENVRHVFTVFRSDLPLSAPFLLPLNLSPSHPSNVMFSIFGRNLEAKISAVSMCMGVEQYFVKKKFTACKLSEIKDLTKYFSSFLFVNNCTLKCFLLLSTFHYQWIKVVILLPSWNFDATIFSFKDKIRRFEIAWLEAALVEATK